ncbi:hypothetical protein H8D85_02590, partial [bacterium]|nr:hypothetical protein [bacterium]
MGLLTETNEQYYAGQQAFLPIATQTLFTWTGDTTLVGTVSNESFTNFTLSVNNVVWTEVTTPPTGNQYRLTATKDKVETSAMAGTETVVIELIDDAKWANYGGYAYITIEEIVNNFLVAYVGAGKLIPDVKRTDVIFHAKRGLQEFSYDTLKSIKSQELTIPPSLSIIIPQDYVNYVKLSYIDDVGIKHIIYPTTLTSNPFTVPIQDANGVPTQDSLGANLEGTSQTNERWDTNNLFTENLNNQESLYYDYNNWYMYRYGRRYGLQPEVAQSNGWFTIDEREGKFSFSSNLAGQLIILEYISDGLSSDLDTKVPKMAE